MKFTIILFAFVTFCCSASPPLRRFNLVKFGDRINPKLHSAESKGALVFSSNFNPSKSYNRLGLLSLLEWLDIFSGQSAAGATNGFSAIKIIFELISKLQTAVDNGQIFQIIEFILQLKREFINLRSFIPSKYYLHIVRCFENLDELQRLAIGGNLTALRIIFAQFKNDLNSIGKTTYDRQTLTAQIKSIASMIQKLQNNLSSGRTKDAIIQIRLIVPRLQTYVKVAPASVRSFFRTLLNLFIKMQGQVSMGHTQSINAIEFEILTMLKRMGKIAKGGGNIEAWWGGHFGLVKGSYNYVRN